MSVEKLTDKQIKEINKTAKDFFDGDTRLAVAAHVHGLGYVLRVGRRVIDSMDKQQISQLKGQVTRANNAKEAEKEKPAEKPQETEPPKAAEETENV